MAKTPAASVVCRTTSPECTTSLESFVHAYLSLSNTIEGYALRAVAADNHCALARAYCCIALSLRSVVSPDSGEEGEENATLLQQFTPMNERDMTIAERIAQHFKRMHECLCDDTPQREWDSCIAIEELFRGSPRGLSLIDKCVEDYPGDLVCLKLATASYLMLGDTASHVNIADKAAKFYPSDRSREFLYGMHSFALVEAGRNREAETWGMMGSGDEYSDPWAQHAVSHVLWTEGRTEEGLRWTKSQSRKWNSCISFMYTHHWWHRALFMLDQEDTDRINASLSLYDKHLWTHHSCAHSLVDCCSLLWRIDQQYNWNDSDLKKSADVIKRQTMKRLSELQDAISPRLSSHIHPFVDAHYAWVYAKLGDKERVQDIIDAAGEGRGCARNQAEVARGLIWGVVKSAEGHFQDAIEHFQPAVERFKEVGGSDAQQDVFMQCYANCLLRAERYGEAQAVLSLRRDNGTIGLNKRQVAFARSQLSGH